MADSPYTYIMSIESQGEKKRADLHTEEYPNS